MSQDLTIGTGESEVDPTEEHVAGAALGDRGLVGGREYGVRIAVDPSNASPGTNGFASEDRTCAPIPDCAKPHCDREARFWALPEGAKWPINLLAAFCARPHCDGSLPILKSSKQNLVEVDEYDDMRTSASLGTYPR